MKQYHSKYKSIPIGLKKAIILVIIFLSWGCEKLVEVDPPIQNITSSTVYNSNATAISVLTGIYIDMSNTSIFSGRSSLSLYAGLSADELIPVTDPGNILSFFYRNNLINDEGGLWSNLYAYIFRVNSAIGGISSSKSLSPSTRQQLLGEAMFLRAFYYFYLVNFYGDVPLLTSTNLKVNSLPSRTSKTQVYDQIIQDLTASQELLTDNYMAVDMTSSTSERVRPNKGAVTALLARVYLYTEQWSNAEREATKLITNKNEYRLESLDNIFLSNSKEAIWQLQPVGSALEANTLDGLLFILADDKLGRVGPNASQGRPVYLSSEIYNTFEIGDHRKLSWVDSIKVLGNTYPYVFKYKQYLNAKPRTEYLMVLRLGEQYLIRAEARARQGNITGVGSATEDLNAIRTRADLESTQALTLTDMLNAILRERKVELFTEFGHRWLDLKRTGKIDERMNVLAPLKGGVWSSYKALYPIPILDIQRNPNLKGHQNPGYPEL